MDTLDEAKALEMQQREIALTEALQRPDHSPGEQAIIITGCNIASTAANPSR